MVFYHVFFDIMSSTASKRILIADDEQYIRELYQEVLAAEGYEIDTARDGKEALEKILEGGYDLIALDVIMPQLDGLGILAHLQTQKPKKANGPILLLTSLINDPAVREANGKGVSKVIYKTEINPDQFVAEVKKLIGSTPQPAQKPDSEAKPSQETSPKPTAPPDQSDHKSAQ